MVDKCRTVVCEVIMQTEEKLFKYQEQMKKALRPKRFSVYAFVFNSLYYLLHGMPGWFMLYFFGGSALIFVVFAFTRSLGAAFAMLLLLRFISALTAERLKQKHMKSFIDRNQNVNYSKTVTFYFLPVRRLAICAVFSCGLFEFYWMYKNWKAVRRDTCDEEIRPLLRGLFGFFFIWPLLSVIRRNLGRSKTEGRKFAYYAAGYGCSLLIQLFCGLMLYGAFFSYHNVGTGQPPPFGPLVVQPVDRGDAPFPEKLRQPEHSAGAFRVEMDHVIRAKRGEKSAEKRRSHGCQPFPLQRRYRLDPYLFIFFQILSVILAAAHMVSSPVIAHDPVSARRHPGTEFFHHHFDTALPGRHPFMADHGDPESLPILLFSHPSHLYNPTCMFNR